MSQCALMGIVKLVAGVTGLLELAVEDVADMTGFAGYAGMKASQRKFRILVVVESQIDPADGTMALVAHSSIATSVLVIILVTGKTAGALRIILEISTVTGVTAHLSMMAFQWKAGLVVIKFRLFPSGRCMTRATSVATATEVNVVETMAGYTAVGGIFIAFIRMA